MKFGVKLTPKVAKNHGSSIKWTSPFYTDPLQSPPPKSSKNLRCNSILHHKLHSGPDLSGVGVASVHDILGHGMSRK